jgi:hypothetical protein
MNRYFLLLSLALLSLPLIVSAQLVTYSSYEREDNRDINFEIIGKMNNNILVYKNMKWKHKISIFDNDMKTKDIVNLDFMPEKTFNVDFIVYTDFFYMIYQYQKSNILHCMGVKLDANAKKMSEPVELDTTSIPFFSDNKIYSTICSEDRKKIMVFKMQKKNDNLNLVTLLFDDQLKLLIKSRNTIAVDDRKQNYSEFLLDNEGNFIFEMDKQPGIRENSYQLQLVTKKPLSDNLVFHDINLDKKYIDEVKLKIDNLNNRYIINSFYYSKSRGSIEGLFSCTWDKAADKQNPSAFNVFDESLRSEAHTDGLMRFTFDDFFIRQVLVKKDGSYLLACEDYSSQTRNNNNNNWNRWDYLNNGMSSYPNSYYSYNPYYGYYRPQSSFSHESTRYYYANIMVLSIDKDGRADWAKVIHKDQFDDDDDNFLSYSTMNSGGEIHFLFNMDTKNQIVSDESIAADGSVKRNATLKSQERGYEFMSRHSKQVGARELIIPCTYRNYICFAKVNL